MRKPSKTAIVAGIVAVGAALFLAHPASAAVDNYTDVQDGATILTTDTVASIGVDCPTGDVVLGGGGSAIQSGAVWVVQYSRPAVHSGSQPNTWQVQFILLSGTPVANGLVNVRAMCATP